MPNPQATTEPPELTWLRAQVKECAGSLPLIEMRARRAGYTLGEMLLLADACGLVVDGGRLVEFKPWTTAPAAKSAAPALKPAPRSATPSSAEPARLRAEAPAIVYTAMELEERKRSILGHPAARGKEAAATTLLFANVSIEQAVRCLGGEPVAPPPTATTPAAPRISPDAIYRQRAEQRAKPRPKSATPSDVFARRAADRLART